ncbi:MAG: helix-turn-helix transcriptional regulator [Actinobacteria bacterium]|nr:helix-turn-helix transcriptional regulator [Actinomycetota bacterium]
MEWKKAKKIINKDPEVLEELKNLELEYQIKSQIITLRKEKKLTQKELAELIGDKQSNISRLESGNYNPTLAKLKKIADCLNQRLDIRFVDKVR